ncbi:hypothetical protein PRIPAC_85277 [Pristionchus pacificus]|uniref:Uncharacterized protein n=1 Tax=Pristionchus pacificus TaxID=54126 RepID=A0A2A6BRZ6_PRIPA|nr:hypothetical protein PRIPAC_85277 [Pristionchus pacificus]|eukprot:PDM68648.1 hypothetical protein PRIPAC_46950 [Pristionchus pacificus]
MSLGGSHLLEGDELVAALLEALDDLADESTVDTVRLDHDEAALVVGHPAKYRMNTGARKREHNSEVNSE